MTISKSRDVDAGSVDVSISAAQGLSMPGEAKQESASRLIDARIEELPGWQGALLSRIRRLIKQAEPAVVEEWKWRGVPVWSSDGMI